MERALYAETTRAHIENKPPNLGNAYARACLMMHTRLTAYGKKWETWGRKRVLTSQPNIVPLRIQEGYRFIKIDNIGDGYYVHTKFLTEVKAARI